MEEALAKIFEEWMRQYVETPDAFVENREPASYGVAAARTFVRLASELGLSVCETSPMTVAQLRDELSARCAAAPVEQT